MLHHSTGYADVDAVLAELLAAVRGTLGPQLVGVYLEGSLAIGDFSEHSSDIDVLVVTEETLSDEVIAALGTMHARLATGTAAFAARRRLPAVSAYPEHAQAGGLLTYATSYYDLFRRAATYVDRIVKGAKPGDLPIEQPTKFELIVNLKAAKTLGLTIPPTVLARADQVIE